MPVGRLHLFELEDQSWFPQSIRDAGTDYIRFLAEVGNLYRPVIPRLKEALLRTQSQEILDLCSGGGGPVVGIQKQLVEAGCAVIITLTDKFPNRAAFEYVRELSGGNVDFLADPVDATAVPQHLAGFRTLWTSFHHFRPETARRILQDAVDQRRPIGVFEFTQRSFRHLLPVLLNPLIVLLTVPFLRPFRWSRLFWTYAIPVVPLYVLWDGAVSCLRTYSPQELQGLVNGLGSNDYVWEIGRERGRMTPPLTYLIGYPKQVSQEPGLSKDAKEDLT